MTGNRRGLLACIVLTGVAVLVTGAAAQFEGMQIGELNGGDRLKSERQRELVAELARRHLGSTIHGESLADIATLQRLLDRRFISSEQVFELQSLGLVLGDVMASTLRLAWVAVDDEYGHSRALRFRQTDHLFFPVTMISKRVRTGVPVEIAAIYRKIADEVAELESRPR